MHTRWILITFSRKSFLNRNRLSRITHRRCQVSCSSCGLCARLRQRRLGRKIWDHHGHDISIGILEALILPTLIDSRILIRLLGSLIGHHAAPRGSTEIS